MIGHKEFRIPDPLQHMDPAKDAAVIGLGNVGLTLAVSLAQAGLAVVGVDTDSTVRATVHAGKVPFFEPGLGSVLRALPPGRLEVRGQLEGTGARAIIVCVGTPMDRASIGPDLSQLETAIDAVVSHVADDTLVVIRSTVPVGTTRRVVLPRLRRQVAAPLLAYCPDRSIQGRALEELESLPQIIGGLDDRSIARAWHLFAPIVTDHVQMSSLEAAETVKLICNAHTDLIYGFGNEVARMAAVFELDADELIESANFRYPRPDLSRPGFVGGSCLTKDSYFLIHAAASSGYWPGLVAAARLVNESVPAYIASRIMTALTVTGRNLADSKVLVCGIAYKGNPETDDVRGSASIEISSLLKPRVGMLAGHDFLVPPERIALLGFEPGPLEEGLADADAVIILINHPAYASIDLTMLDSRMRHPPIVFDVWGMLKDVLDNTPDFIYLRLGRG